MNNEKKECTVFCTKLKQVIRLLYKIVKATDKSDFLSDHIACSLVLDDAFLALIKGMLTRSRWAVTNAQIRENHGG